MGYFDIEITKWIASFLFLNTYATISLGKILKNGSPRWQDMWFVFHETCKYPLKLLYQLYYYLECYKSIIYECSYVPHLANVTYLKSF